MAQALSEIYNSLNGGGYDAQRNVYNQQLGAVDGQTQGVIAGLNTQKDQAFQGITNQANNNGMFYSGAPIQEEQKYTGGTYLPALANVQTQAQNQKFGLQQALAGVNTAQTGAAQGIYQNQVQQDQQQNYYNQQLAQQKAYNDSMANMYRGGGSGGGGGSAAPSQNQILASAFNGYDPNKQGKQANYTEQQIAPQIAAALNIPYAQALQQAYQYRKQVYKQ